jgi:hypothetical protein
LDVLESLSEALDRGAWDFDRDDNRFSSLVELVEEAQRLGELETIYQWLIERQLRAAWHLGRAFATVVPDGGVLVRLAESTTLNAPALAGYLTERWLSTGQTAGYEAFLESDLGRQLSRDIQLYLTVCGPNSETNGRRLVRLVNEVPAGMAARGLIRWNHPIDDSTASDLIQSCIGRVEGEQDYLEIITWVSIRLVERLRSSESLREEVGRLIALRRTFPELGHERWGWANLAEHVVREQPHEIANLILDLIDGGVILMAADPEAALLRTAASVDPTGIWELVGSRLEGGVWRVVLMLRGWFTEAVPIEVISDWISDSESRARLAASIATAGTVLPTPIALHLLTTFPDDKEIASSLAGEFISGGYSGSRSAGLAKQIGQLEAWTNDPDLPSPVREWARKLILDLRTEREHILRFEAERGW